MARQARVVMMRLEAQELAFGYVERPVGRNVSLVVQPGEVLCLLGPNGCGKTTLFKTLLGLLPPQGGQVTLSGDELASLSRQEIARRIAYVPQASGGVFPYTAFDLVLLGRTAHRSLFAGPTREDRDHAHRTFRAGISDLSDRDVTRLSSGQRQLVIVARAIAQAAPLIVMDEPTASLDFGNQVVVLSEVRRLADRGAGIVLSTHDPDHAFAVAHRVALLHEGTIVTTGAPADVLTAESLRTVYDIEVTIERLRNGQTICAPTYLA
jgi:iron complex transport system ATP-binding protein